ncbi:aldehyde dehydrogenase [Burkholderia sp. L27(2015)]|uniref:aldehyde dehydrogenase n=1 Tax=Burkholderia sp. L27(2015) TaxID=1641858 RepID=UPI00131A92DF|nr:aldehyde dehydrogenase [Burkholderia sp. L27(2015)]
MSNTEVQMFIDGASVPGAETYESFNPATGEPWALVANGTAADVDTAVKAARKALTGDWGQLTAPARGKLLWKLASLIERDAERLAQIETRDNGKLLREMSEQMRALPDWYRYFAGMADKVTGKVVPTDKSNYLVYTQEVPVGVVAMITPWNSPLLLLTFKLAAALAAGCTAVIKPSDYTPASTVELAKLAHEAGFPPGVVNVVTGVGPETGKALSTHPDINKIAFTGSTEVGRAIAHAAAENFARTTLELGGKSAQIVFPDADLAAAANGVIAGIFAASGQTCLAGSRLIAHSSIADELVKRIVARAQTIVLGDPTDPTTEMGPLANDRQLAKVLEHFEAARAEGATFACGGKQVPELGALFVQPTVLTGLRPDARSLNEEIFGPVLSVITFDSEDEAVAIANNTKFGLAGGVWTKDIHQGHRVASRLRTGTVWVNTYRVVAPQVPFGGFGDSGIGRENGADAIHAYLETKAIWIELSGKSRDPFVIG